MTATTTRRAILAGAAALPALTVPAIGSTEPDPIFAAIDRHKAAFRAYGDAITVTDRLDTKWWAVRKGRDDVRPPELQREFDEAEAKADALGDAQIVAEWEMVTTHAPTTLLGVLGLLAYAHQHAYGNRHSPFSDPPEALEQYISTDDWWAEAARCTRDVIIRHLNAGVVA